MENENSEPENYCGASAGHVIASRFVLKECEPLKLFGNQDPDDSITWLDLSDSKGIIDYSTFILLPGLKHLYIDNCEFEKWSSGTFSSLKNLSSLTLTRTKLALDSNTFNGSNTLECLSISDIKDVGSNLFCKLENLEQLTLEKCKFGSLNAETFSGLKNVTYLKLSECEISSISEDAFEALENLDMFIFNNNIIGELDWNSFLKFNNLTELTFHDNIFNSSVNYEIFQKLPKLESILFETSIYKELDFDAFPALKKVNLSMQESNELVDEIVEKLKSKNLECEFALCGKVEVDMNDEELQICC